MSISLFFAPLMEWAIIQSYLLFSIKLTTRNIIDAIPVWFAPIFDVTIPSDFEFGGCLFIYSYQWLRSSFVSEVL